MKRDICISLALPTWLGWLYTSMFPDDFSHTVHIDTFRIQSPWANINHHHKSINPIFPLKYHITIGNINPHFFTCFSLMNPHFFMVIQWPFRLLWAFFTPPEAPWRSPGVASSLKVSGSAAWNWSRSAKRTATPRPTRWPRGFWPPGRTSTELSKERGMCVVADYEQTEVNIYIYILGMNRKWRLTSIVGLMLNVDLVVGCSSQSRSEYKPYGSVW